MNFIKVDDMQLQNTFINKLPEVAKELSLFNIKATKGNFLSIFKKKREIQITYTKKTDFFRALSHLRGLGINEDFEFFENTYFNFLSFMLDCSRNGVINQESFKKLVGLLALMGYNSIMLYTEDTYEITNEPFFGHLRGRFTSNELQFMDNYANEFGIVLIPCIQTLAHLDAIFKWPAYENVKDINNILLCESKETYDLIEKMFQSLSKNFQSRRVNIGMDEAHFVGLGKYLDMHGYHNRTQIMLRHLHKVIEIADKYGFICSMWSDMFFRLANGGKYYINQEAARLDKSITSLVPKNIELIYWDYYHTKIEEYDNMFNRHFDFDNKIIFAGGAWRWTGITPTNKFGLMRIIPGIKSCRKNNIKEVIVTSWGDNGNETSLYSSLPQILVYAEYIYHENPDEEYLERRMRQTTDASFKDLLKLDIANTPNDYNNYVELENRSKTLLYNDPLLGIMDYKSYELIATDYKKAAQVLIEAGKQNIKWHYIFNTQATLCLFLSYKANLGIELKAAYDTKNKQELGRIANEIIPEATKMLNKFSESLRNQWYSENKTFGFEVIQIRLGGIKERLIETMRRVNDYLTGKVDSIEELQQERLIRHHININNNYQMIATPCIF